MSNLDGGGFFLTIFITRNTRANVYRIEYSPNISMSTEQAQITHDGNQRKMKRSAGYVVFQQLMKIIPAELAR